MGQSFACGCGGRYNGAPVPPEFFWIGTTMNEWVGDGSASRPASGKGTSWSKGDASAFSVRHGPDYGRNRTKAPSLQSLYECISVDLVRANRKIGEVLGRLAPFPPPVKDCKWTSECPIPRVLCVVAMLPDANPLAAGALMGRHEAKEADPGCSVVTIHLIRQETIEAFSKEPCAPALDLFAKFVQEAGELGGCPDGDKKSSGIFKGIGLAENPEDATIPSYMKMPVWQWNGTPALITKSGSVFQAPDKEWFEIDIDVRLFSVAARTALFQLRSALTAVTVHVGFVIQGYEDPDLPECILCSCRLHNLDLLRSAFTLEDSILHGVKHLAAQSWPVKEASEPVPVPPSSRNGGAPPLA